MCKTNAHSWFKKKGLYDLDIWQLRHLGIWLSQSMLNENAKKLFALCNEKELSSKKAIVISYPVFLFHSMIRATR